MATDMKSTLSSPNKTTSRPSSAEPSFSSPPTFINKERQPNRKTHSKIIFLKHQPSEGHSTRKHRRTRHQVIVYRCDRSPGPVYDVSQSMLVTKTRPATAKIPHDDRVKTKQTPIHKLHFKSAKIAHIFISQRQQRQMDDKETNFLRSISQSTFYIERCDKEKVCDCIAATPVFLSDDRQKYFVTKTFTPGVGTYNTPSMVGYQPSKNTVGTWSRQHRDVLEWAFRYNK
ncbi:MAG: hypothetical protein EZS28_023218 [Streblomastix strix]|uniref:Uncharacterized protein n=1 Tax=Streblomastix strix TaxID=222440 RepID=A0A5J4VFR4_9EUKA|nr:MAG: hypothetical protein EZS28_023218 [Streblomastix strix]